MAPCIVHIQANHMHHSLLLAILIGVALGHPGHDTVQMPRGPVTMLKHDYADADVSHPAIARFLQDKAEFEDKHADDMKRLEDLTRVEPATNQGRRLLSEGNQYGRMGQEYQQKLWDAQRNKDIIRAIYSVALYPSCQPYAAGATIPTSVMAANSTGRIHPLGSFHDPEASKEYFLLACPDPAFPQDTQLRVSQAVFHRFVSWEGETYWDVDLLLEIPAIPSIARNLTHIGHACHNSDGSVQDYKILFQRLELRDAPVTPVSLANRVNTFCASWLSVTTNLTLDPADEYTNQASCIDFVTIRAANGTGYAQADQDSLRCREFHLGLVNQNLARAADALTDDLRNMFISRAILHARHSGPRGGAPDTAKCVEHTLASFVFDPRSC